MTADQPSLFPSQPLVTVGVASYNNSKYILETLDSIANQTYKNLEIIINDDVSTDESVALIKDWITKNPDLNIKLIINSENQGICKAGNNILKNANGKYVCLIGSDDRYLPEFIDKRVKLLESTKPEIGLCYSLSYFIDMEGNRNGVEDRPTPSGWVFNNLVDGYNSLCKPFTCLIKKDCFDKVGFYDESLMYEDFDWFLRATREYEVLFFNSYDTEYRSVPGSLGKKLNSHEGSLSNIAIISKHLGYSKITDLYFRKRLLRLALKAYKNGLPTTRAILKLSINNFYGLKEMVFLIVSFIPVKWLISVKGLLRKPLFILAKSRP